MSQTGDEEEKLNDGFRQGRFREVGCLCGDVEVFSLPTLLPDTVPFKVVVNVRGFVLPPSPVVTGTRGSEVKPVPVP